MARVFIDGFESGDNDLWDTIDAATVISSAGLDMDGNYCLRIVHGQSINKEIPANATYYFAFLFRYSDVFGDDMYFRFYHDATEMCRLRIDSQTLKAYRGANDLLGSGTKNIAQNVTYLIEIKLVIHDTTGEFIVKVDGVADINLINQDTKPGAETTINEVKYQVAGTSTTCYADNIIVDNAAWIGSTKIQAVVPTGVGNKTEWDPSVGANWQCVDEKPANDADYVSTNVNDETDTYAAGNMAGSIGSVKCVQVQSRIRTEGAPTPTNLKLVVRSGGTDYLSGDKAVPGTEKSFYHLWEDNPADAAAWEEADVNAMEIGIKSAA